METVARQGLVWRGTFGFPLRWREVCDQACGQHGRLPRAKATDERRACSQAHIGIGREPRGGGWGQGEWMSMGTGTARPLAMEI